MSLPELLFPEGVFGRAGDYVVTSWRERPQREGGIFAVHISIGESVRLGPHDPVFYVASDAERGLLAVSNRKRGTAIFDMRG